MFDELEKYELSDHFFYSGRAPMEEVCNAPLKGAGVYLIYTLAHGRIELVYVGSAGILENNGTVVTNGLHDQVVNFRQFHRKRSKSWERLLINDKIDALDIYWYETFNEKFGDIPSFVQRKILQLHFDLHGTLPRWNSSC